MRRYHNGFKFVYDGWFFNAENIDEAYERRLAGDDNPWQTLWDLKITFRALNA